MSCWIERIDIFFSCSLPPQEQFAIIASPNEEKEEQKCVIPLESAFSFVSRKYRIVVSLDVSPSMAVQDPDSGDVLLDRARKAIDMCLHSMACLASSNQKQPMDIYLTVLTQGCVTRPVQVLCQGMLLTPANVSNILQRIATQLMESEVAASKTWATMCVLFLPLFFQLHSKSGSQALIFSCLLFLTDAMLRVQHGVLQISPTSSKTPL